jgi:hypothetical protein
MTDRTIEKSQPRFRRGIRHRLGGPVSDNGKGRFSYWLRCGVMVATVPSGRCEGQKMTGGVPGLLLRNGEFVVQHDRATLKKFVRARVGHGTRVRVGPFYFGGWKSIPKEELREASTGDLVLTNQRLLFLGAQTLTIPFDKLLKCEQVDAGLVISQSEREHPLVLVLKNAGLWCFLVNCQVGNRKIRP